MRLAVINLTSGGFSGGYQKYLNEILPRMASHADITALFCALPEPVRLPYSFKKIFNLTIVKCKPYHPLKFFKDQELNTSLMIFKPDVIFVPLERYFQFNNIHLKIYGNF